MNPRITSLIVAIAMVPVVSLSFTRAGAQTEPEKRPGPVPQATKVPTTPPGATAGPAGAPATLDDESLKAQVDSTLLWMQSVISDAQSLSASFATLAPAHHGADRSEILMMQRMSDAMATMAGEVMTTLRQYKTMLDDETASDTGAMKADVQELKAAIVVIAGEVADAVQSLHRLQAQLGQG
jgi:hypothetical protein